MDGLLIINKEKDYTSRDVVNIVSHELKTKKIGHTGTLDPLATGVLVLCIGKATKLVDVITAVNKEYEAEITLGILTDTLDITGNILKEEIPNISDQTIIEVVSSMKGTYNQEVPIYSAIKVKGKKLYEYARNNEEVELPKRLVTIENIEIISPIKRENNRIIFNIKTTVSKGTYIRSLVNDIATKLGTIGVMSKLNRTKQGTFNLNDSYTINDIKNNKYKITPIEFALKDFYSIIVDKNLEKKVINGAKLPNIYNKEAVLFKNNTNILALYKQDEKDPSILRVWKML